MAERPRLAALALLVLLFAAGLYTVGVQPAQVVVTEAFPAGLLAGSWLLVPRRRRPGLAVASAFLVALVYLLCGRDVWVALGWGVAVAFGAWVATEVLTRGGSRRAALITNDDLKRFIQAGFLGAFAAASLASAVAAVTGFAPWWVAMLGVCVAQFATYLTLMPHFMGRPRFPGVARRAERQLQWALTVSATFLCFLPWNQWPSLAFVILPLLGWSALRAPMRETLVQLLVVTVLSHALTMRGMGPFAAQPGDGPVRADLLTASYALYICACALTTIPFALSVGIQAREAWQARAEQARVRQLVQSASGIAIIGTDSTGHIDLFNPGAEQILGYRAEEVLGLMPSIFHTQREVERLARKFSCPPNFTAVALRLAEGSTPHSDVEFMRKDGQLLTLQFSMSRIHDEARRITGFVATGEDVTDRVNRQRALEEALAAERVAVENLKEVDQVKDALVSGVSHELRTPITSILGYLEVLEDGGFGDLSPRQAVALGRVKGNSNRLLALIDDLLMLSRIQDGYEELEHSAIDLRTVVEAARSVAAPNFTAAGIDLRCSLPESSVPVYGDALRLGRVMDNILGNALKFTDRMGVVDVELVTKGGAAVLTVRDSGIGIPATEQPKVFDRFFRAAAARERAIQGSGLGLSIARALVQSHGGRIEVESSEGVGSTFRVRLPLEGASAIPEQDRAGVRSAPRPR